MERNNKTIIYLIIILVLIIPVIAQGVEVVKEAPQEISLNDIIEIKINIFNPSSTEEEFTIEEILPGDIQIIEPTTISTRRYDALEIKYYNWITTISSNKIKTLTYKIKPLSLGEYVIGPTKVITGTNIYSSNKIKFKVKCVPNNKCESNENSITCPADCPTGISDGICDYKADGICDPDCKEEPDCRKSDFNMMYVIIPFIIILAIILLIWLIPKIFKKKDRFPIQKKSNISTQQDPLSGIGNTQ